MDIYSSTSPTWLQQQQQQQQAQQQLQSSDAQSAQRPASADWKDSTLVPNGGATPTPVQGGIDLSDFGLGDLSVPQPSSSSPTSFFPFPHSYFSVPGPYNAMGYAAAAWPNQPGSVPLSSYSTLNGATTSTMGSSQSTQSSTPQQTMIDPALTTINTSNATSQPYASSSNISQSQPSPQLTQRPAPQYSYTHMHPSALSYVHAAQFSTSQQQSQHQGTLSPFALHSPSMMTGIPPTSFYNNPATVTVPVQSRKEQFLSAIKPSLSPKSFSGARGVQQLVNQIAEYGITQVDAQTRLDILTKIRDNAGNHFFRAWLENPTAMEIAREWLKAGATNTDDDQLQETIMPLLHITDRLPFTYESLAASKVGRIIRKLGKDALIPAVKDMASNLERKWREKYVPEHERAMNVDEDPQARKRKAEPPASKSAQPTKKAAVSSASSSRPVVVKKESKAAPQTVKDSKSDSSFFSAPKPKPRLPSFKKSPAPPPLKKEPDPNVAQPSAVDPFQEALKDMAKGRKPSPAAVSFAANHSTATGSSTQTPTGLTKSGKKKKVVKWAPEGQLELVKLIEKAIYDDDPVDGVHSLHNVRDLDRDEGAALHAHLFEELIDWSEPQSIQFSPNLDVPPRGGESQEKTTQEQRELTALGAMYLSLQQIPESPAEPATQIQPELVDEHVLTMLVGPDVDSLFFSTPRDQPAMGASVSDLVDQLASNPSSTPGMTSAKSVVGFDPNLIAQVTSMGNLPPEQLQHLAQLLAQQSAFSGGAPSGTQGDYSAPEGDQDWGSAMSTSDGYGGEYGLPAGDERRWGSEGAGRGDRGRGGSGGARGRGRGRPDGLRESRARIPCTFYAQGRCRYGDQCDFSHEPLSY